MVTLIEYNCSEDGRYRLDIEKGLDHYDVNVIVLIEISFLLLNDAYTGFWKESFDFFDPLTKKLRLVYNNATSLFQMRQDGESCYRFTYK